MTYWLINFILQSIARNIDELISCEHDILLTVDPEPVDCSHCDFTNGQVWLQDPDNCHMYYICEFRYGHAFKHHMTCGDLYWNQPYHTCVPVKPADAACDEGDVVTYRPKPTQIGECMLCPLCNNILDFYTLLRRHALSNFDS